MKVVILAGGFGSRLCEETFNKPKALVKIGTQPIIWHIMNYYSHFGLNEFVIALGYNGQCLRNWVKSFKNFKQKTILKNDLLEVDSVSFTGNEHAEWFVHMVDTGLNTQTGGRIKRLAPIIGDETFMLTFCDGLSDVNLRSLLNFHRSHGRLATVTAVRPQSRFGHLILKGNRVLHFEEKPRLDWINGAFCVFEPGVLDYIEDDTTNLTKDSLKKLADAGELMAFRHNGFWQCMDNMSEKVLLEKIWNKGKAPWKK
ncbi:MAG: NTP transferase domain-containing protein [Candidatus Bathyarchaeota archaeon]|nr:MAG: NTP transferase domain-containing protein [Candidatus Bathyarchaeota archaeon]